MFFPTSFVRKNLLLNISITSFSQYTTICFVSFLYSVFNEHLLGLCHFLCKESNQRNFIEKSLFHFRFSENFILTCQNFTRLRISLLTQSKISLQASGLLGGDDGIRTHDPLLAGQVLSQLSYTPIYRVLLFLRFLTFTK